MYQLLPNYIESFNLRLRSIFGQTSFVCMCVRERICITVLIMSAYAYVSLITSVRSPAALNKTREWLHCWHDNYYFVSSKERVGWVPKIMHWTKTGKQIDRQRWNDLAPLILSFGYIRFYKLTMYLFSVVYSFQDNHVKSKLKYPKYRHFVYERVGTEKFPASPKRWELGRTENLL